MPLMHDADVPMSLGDHLEELRRRLKWPLIILGIGFFTAFMYEATLQQIFAQPPRPSACPMTAACRNL